MENMATPPGRTANHILCFLNVAQAEMYPIIQAKEASMSAKGMVSVLMPPSLAAFPHVFKRLFSSWKCSKKLVASVTVDICQ